MSSPEPSGMQAERAAELHSRAIVVDSLLGSLGDPRRAIEAGLAAVHVTVATYTDDFRAAIRSIYNHYGMVDVAPDSTLLVTGVEDIERAKGEGKVGLILGFQGGNPIEDDLELLTIFHRLGIRVIGPTYMERNLLGDGCLEPENRGLTYFGIQFVREMNRLGMLIDLSHAGYAVCEDVISYSKQPVALTHTNPRTLCDVPRNVPDSIIQGVAGAGGYIGVSPYSAIVGRPENGRPGIGDFLRHLDHVVGLVGAEHVGIGTDFFDGKGPANYVVWSQRRYPDALGGFAFPERHAAGFDSITRWPHVTSELLAHGYSEEEVLGFLGGNFLRLLKRVWS
jgi:membrane dipeptidase